MLPIALLATALFTAPLAASPVVPVVSPIVAVQAEPAAFNPTATLRVNQTTITVTSVVAGTLALSVAKADGTPIKQLLPATAVTAGSTTSVTWDGALVADGQYGIHATLTDAAGVVAESIAPVAVDAHGPQVTLARPFPVDATGGPVTVSIRTTGPLPLKRLDLTVIDQTGTDVGTVRVPLDAVRTSGTLRWNLRLKGRSLLSGIYTLRADAVDELGIAGSSGTRLLRLRRSTKTRIVYSLPEAKHMIGLSFDDCGKASAWDGILDAFRTAKAKTTFFCNGVNVRSFPQQARRTVAEGHTIGSHTWSHPQLPTLSLAAQVSQIQGDIDIWWSVARASPAPFFRPPYGLHNATTLAAASSLGFAYTMLWNVDPSDYLHPSQAELVRRVVSHARAGAIVVMHVDPNTLAALPELIRQLRAIGLEPSSLEQLFAGAARLMPRARG